MKIIFRLKHNVFCLLGVMLISAAEIIASPASFFLMGEPEPPRSLLK